MTGATLSPWRKFIPALLLSLTAALPLTPSTQPPALYLWNGAYLHRLRAAIADRRPLPRSTTLALNHLIRTTEHDLRVIEAYGMPAIVNKSLTPFNNDPHYFTSLVPYAFPCNNLPHNCVGYNNTSHNRTICHNDGLPWKICDGRLNNHFVFPDRRALETMIHYVIRLSLSGYLLTDQNRSETAAELLKTWFLRSHTRMHPSLKFAQGIPGVTNGKHSGCMDLYFFGRGFTDAITLLSLTPNSHHYFTHTHRQHLSSWFAQMALQMVNNPKLNPESNMRNNHGVYYDLTVTSLALLANDSQSLRIVRKVSGERHCWQRAMRRWCLQGRFESQIDENGRFKYELHRADPGHYLWYTLLANSYLATFASAIGNHAYGGVVKAADWALQHALNPVNAEISGQHIYAVHAYRMLAVITGSDRYDRAACEIMKALVGPRFWQSDKVGTDVLELTTPPLRPCAAWDMLDAGHPTAAAVKRSRFLIDQHEGPGIFRNRSSELVAWKRFESASTPLRGVVEHDDLARHARVYVVLVYGALVSAGALLLYEIHSRRVSCLVRQMRKNPFWMRIE